MGPNDLLGDTTGHTFQNVEEKREAYLTIPSLRVYIILDQDRPAAAAWRRGGQGFAREHYSGLEAVVELPEIEARLPLSDIYEAVEFGGAESEGEA